LSATRSQYRLLEPGGFGDGYMTAFSRMEESYSWDGLNCYDNYNAYTVGETDPMSVVPTLSVGTVSVSPSVISSTQDATLNITLAVSSGAVNTNGTTLEVGIANATGTFQLTFTPSSQNDAATISGLSYRENQKSH
jgi:hypothetical protein